MGESSKAFSADKGALRRTHIGGQALIEGVMMRGRYNWAVAVREPDGGIYTEEHDLASGKKKNSWMYWPIVRGCTAFVESLVLGYKALSISADHAYDLDEDEPAAKAPAQLETPSEAHAGELGPAAEVATGTDPTPIAEPQDEESEGGLGVLMTVSMVIGLVLGVIIFVVLPAALSNLVLGEESMNTLSWNVFDGVVRVAIFIAYIWLISLMKDIKRLFSYHGAEHVTIHCFEHGLDLTPENALRFPRLHVRCGTAFMIMVMIIAIFVYTVLSSPINALVDLTGITEGPLRFTLIVFTRIVLMPVIAGLSYEITVKWAGQRPENPLVKVILWPGMQMQRLTTNPPDEGMVECAITAMQLVLDREEAEARGAQASAQ